MSEFTERPGKAVGIIIINMDLVILHRQILCMVWEQFIDLGVTYEAFGLGGL